MNQVRSQSACYCSRPPFPWLNKTLARDHPTQLDGSLAYYLSNAAGFVSLKTWFMSLADILWKQSKSSKPSLSKQFTTRFFFHKRQTLLRHAATSSGTGSMTKLLSRLSCTYWCLRLCSKWKRTLLPTDALPYCVGTVLFNARWAVACHRLGFLICSLDVKWLVSRKHVSEMWCEKLHSSYKAS